MGSLDQASFPGAHDITHISMECGEQSALFTLSE